MLLVKSKLVAQHVLFSIVKDLGPYNVITYHKTVSYLTNVGQVDLLNSQLAAWKCYQLSM